MDEEEAPALTLRDIIGSDADDDDDHHPSAKKPKRAKRIRPSDASDSSSSEDDEAETEPPSKKRARKNEDHDAAGDEDPRPVEGTCFGIQRKLVESMLTFKIRPNLKRRLQIERVDVRTAHQSNLAECRQIFLSQVIQGLCPATTHPCERCGHSASYWICGETLDRKVNRANQKGIIYEAFRLFYNDAEKLPDMTGVNWHNFMISDVLRFSDIQFRPTFLLAADIVELLCANRCFVAHIKQPRLGRRLADFLLFALQFYASENALKQIANRMVPEIGRLGLIIPPTIPSLADAIRSPARSIRKKRILRRLKQLVQFVLQTPHGFGSRSDRCVLLTRLFLMGLRRPG